MTWCSRAEVGGLTSSCDGPSPLSGFHLFRVKSRALIPGGRVAHQPNFAPKICTLHSNSVSALGELLGGQPGEKRASLLKSPAPGAHWKFCGECNAAAKIVTAADFK
jgi:hypothetical protein